MRNCRGIFQDTKVFRRYLEDKRDDKKYFFANCAGGIRRAPNMKEICMSYDVQKGDIIVRSETDGTVCIHLNRDDLFDLYFGLARKGFDYKDPFVIGDLKVLIRKFFVDQEDVQTDPRVSLRFEDPDLYEDLSKYRS